MMDYKKMYNIIVNKAFGAKCEIAGVHSFTTPIQDLSYDLRIKMEFDYRSIRFMASRS